MTSNPAIEFPTILARYHKAERERSEQCIADILTIITDAVAGPDEREDQIIARLVQHYTR